MDHENVSRTRSVVGITRLKDGKDEQVREGFFSLLDSLGGFDRMVPKSTRRVLVKPNLVTGKPWDTGITVHPLLIELLVSETKKLGLPVMVGEGSGWGCESGPAFRSTGVDLLCERLCVPLVDFKRGRGIKVPVRGGLKLKELLVDETVPGCDFIISLAKMKTHCETIVSLSLKNIKGLITEDRERLRFHLLDVNRCLVDLASVFRPHLAIVEGIVALEGIGPLEPGTPKPVGVLLGGVDPVAVDAVCSRIMGVDPERIRHLALASEAGLGVLDSDRIDVKGASVDEVRPDSYELPPLSIAAVSPFESVRIADGKPCSNCIASIASCLHGYIDRKTVERSSHTVTILIGAKAKAEGKGNEIALGNCLKKYKGKIPFVPGCPPPSDAYLELLYRGLKGYFHASTAAHEGDGDVA